MTWDFAEAKREWEHLAKTDTRAKGAPDPTKSGWDDTRTRYSFRDAAGVVFAQWSAHGDGARLERYGDIGGPAEVHLVYGAEASGGTSVRKKKRHTAR